MKKIIAIGNAIVDVVCKIDDEYLAQNLLIKGSMSLIDENTTQKLSQITPETIASGGSAANTIAAISGLGAATSFVGKVGNDKIGRKFISEIEKNGTNFVVKKYSNGVSANSFILVTPDAQRTMATFLGCASEIVADDIKEEFFEGASILYLEGYLWDKKDTIEALRKAISLAKKHDIKIAFTLSDTFCVSRHKADFANLIANDIDILFANENEIKELTGIENIEENNFAKLMEFFAKNKKLLAAITRSEKGCVIFRDKQNFEFAAEKIAKLLDTTGAGDCFAAGLLFGINNNFALDKSAKLANLLASRIIQKFGARFENSELTEIKNVI